MVHSWTEVNNVNTGRYSGGGLGTSTAAFFIAGTEPAFSTKVESWNGTSWTETTDMNTARAGLDGAGESSTSALAFGGNTPSATAATENWVVLHGQK